MLNSDVLPANAGPAGGMRPYIEMEKTAIVDANAAIQEGRDLKRQFIHLLQRKTGDRNINRLAAGMFAVNDAAHLKIMGVAPIPVMYDDGLARERTKQFESVDKRGFNLQLAAAVAGKFRLREMSAQITHGS